MNCHSKTIYSLQNELVQRNVREAEIHYVQFTFSQNKNKFKNFIHWVQHCACGAAKNKVSEIGENKGISIQKMEWDIFTGVCSSIGIGSNVLRFKDGNNGCHNIETHEIRFFTS